jgi:hypothetical protein
MRKEMPNLSGVSGQLCYLFKNPLSKPDGAFRIAGFIVLGVAIV